MNIFYLDSNIEECARAHVDKHVVKMVTEYAQLLSTAVRFTGLDVGYKATHNNHPSAVWARESRQNWLWLRDLSEALNFEYMYRYDKMAYHKAYQMIESLPVPDLPDVGLTTLKLAMPDDVKCDDPVSAYRAYYNKYKRHIASWKHREVPIWYTSD